MTTFLCSPKYKRKEKYELFVVVAIYDSYGGRTNVTNTVEVNPNYSEV